MSRSLAYQVICLIGVMTLLFACSGDPVSTNPEDAGNVTLSIKGLGSPTLAKESTTAGSRQVTVTSARFVFEKIELENKSDSSVDFKFDEPFIEDLLAITSLAEIQTFDVPFGTYDKIKVDIDDLDAQDGDIFTQNSDLQNLSIRIEGYLDENPEETFGFTSDISINIRLNMKPPLVIDETTINSNLVLDFNYEGWFKGRNGDFLDPAVPGNQQRIEQNIRESFRIFRDDNRDGKCDKDFEVKGKIDSLGDNYLVVRETQFFVTENTEIIPKHRDQPMSFTDLTVGMVVEVKAAVQESGELIATRIEILSDGENSDIDFAVEAPITEIGDNFIVLADTQVFVSNDTRIFSNKRDAISFVDLAVGMVVEVHAIQREDDTLLALKIKVEDDEYDGRKDHFEAVAFITEIGDTFIVLADTQVFVSGDTHVFNAKHEEISFADLTVGMLVEVHAILRDDGTLLALKIKIKEEQHSGFDFEAEAAITEMGDNFIVLAETKVFVSGDTQIIDRNDHHELSFADLAVDVVVKVFAIEREDGTLLALKIKV